LVAGASKGEGLGNKFLANIRECQAIVHVVRAFNDNDVVHVSDKVSPVEDIEIINTELILADLQTIENRSNKLQKEAKANPSARETLTYIDSLKRHLKSGTPLSSLPSLDLEQIKDLNLLTAKPTIYLFNVDEETLINTEKQNQLSALVAPAKSVFVCAKLEEELKNLERIETEELLQSYGVERSGLEQLIATSYETLGLQSYLTAGPKETRAWTIREGSTAPQAAGAIHNDFEKGFIAAQVIDYNDLVETGSEAAAKAAGKIRTEGRDYIMRPDDIVEFRFNVSK